jgi:quercetin dioxygenase-like cupin family protein
MSVNLFEPYTNPITGETFECTSFTPECYRMIWKVAPGGFVPLEHVHYYQDEIFYVKNGVLNLRIEGVNHIVQAGQQITAPRGKSHIADNHGQGELVCDVEYLPGLDYYTFFQCFIGLQMDKDYNKKGQINVPKMAYFMKKTKCNALARPSSIPRPMFMLVLNLFGFIGSIAGWEKQLKRYIQDEPEPAAL